MNNIALSLKNEFERESVSMQKILERIPTEKFDWKPHEKSMTLKQLAVHLAEINGLISLVINKEELDFSTITTKPEITSTEELVEFYKKLKQKSLSALKNTTDEELGKIWVMRNADHIIMKMPKKDMIRVMAMSHAYHHRGQLSVYLRLLNIPVPSIYGPSADEVS